VLAGALAAIAGPWYVRNWLVFDAVIPVKPWTHLARHDLEPLLVMLRGGNGQFGVPGWLFTAALAFAAVRAVSPTRSPEWTVLLAFAGPFGAAWWWLASYDGRFLVTVVPVLAVMAALMLEEAARALAAGRPAAWRRRATRMAALGVVILAPFSLRAAIEHKWVLLRTPFLSDADRHRVRLGGVYDLAVALNRLPAGSRILGVPPLARYHLEAGRIEVVDGAPATTPPPALADRCDYVVYRLQGDGQPEWLEGRRPLLRTADGYSLYATRQAAG
jgi:hypothetical protein